MKKITFHGILKALGKKTYSVKASSWKEICEFLQANVRNYSAIRKRMLEDLDGCYFVVDGKTVESSEVLDHSKAMSFFRKSAEQGYPRSLLRSLFPDTLKFK